MKTNRKTLPSLIASVVILTISYQNAWSMCHGEACNGLDPNIEGCTADGRISNSLDVKASGKSIGGAFLMYSPTCDAFWTIVFSSGYFNARVEATIKRGDGLSQSYKGGEKVLVAETKMLGENGTGLAPCYNVRYITSAWYSGCTSWIY